MKEVKAAIKIIGVALVAAAVAQELAKPAKERIWRGHLQFNVPYDFTLPSAQRLREAYWNPDNDHIFTDRVLGVGWAINAHALLRRIGALPKPEAPEQI